LERRQFDKPQRVSIGKTSAHCERCACEEFVRLKLDKRGEKSDMMACSACGLEHLYTGLLGQIARAVMSRSERALAEAEALRKRLEKLGDDK
jgi:uncharacterized Zn finger protein